MMRALRNAHRDFLIDAKHKEEFKRMVSRYDMLDSMFLALHVPLRKEYPGIDTI